MHTLCTACITPQDNKGPHDAGVKGEIRVRDGEEEESVKRCVG